jgi:hypothetical protein
MATSETEVKGPKADQGNWDYFSEEAKAANGNGSQSDRPKTLYMDMSKPGKYVIRLVGNHVRCRKLFKPYRATLRDEDRGNDPAWKAGFFPQKRFAINIIDRADGKLKILEKGNSVFKQFANYKTTFGKNPADVKAGVDFQVTVTVPKLPNGQPNKLKTEYLITHLRETPLTEEEITMIRAQKLWPLTDIYKPTSLEKRMDMWNGLSDDAKIAPKRDFKDDDDNSSTPSAPKVESKSAPAVEEKMVDSPADSQDLFEDAVGEEGKSDSAELF